MLLRVLIPFTVYVCTSLEYDVISLADVTNLTKFVLLIKVLSNYNFMKQTY